MPREKPLDISLWSGGQDISGPVTLGFESALVLGNLLPIGVACCTKRGRHRIATDELIIALSITDILSVIVPGPLGWASYFSHHWYGGRHTCHFYQVSATWFQLTSMCLITFMTFDRWMSLKDALAYKAPSNHNNCRVRISVFLIYLFTLTVSCLPLVGLAPQAISSSGKICQSWLLAKPRSTLEHVFHFVFLTVGYSNLLTTVLVNVTVMATLWRFQRKFGVKQAERMSSAALQIDRRSVVELTVMTLIVTLAFYLAWLPTLTLLTLLQFDIRVSELGVLYALLSTTLTGLLNPIIYGVFSRSYRRGYYKILTTISKFLFGCPLSQDDVIKNLSGHNRRMRSAGSTSTSLAGLLSTRSKESADGDSNPPAQVPAVTARGTAFSEYEFATGRSKGADCQPARPYEAAETNPADNIYSYDLQDRSYMDELLEKDEQEVSKEMYDSRLSLISEESDDHPEPTADYNESNEKRPICVPVVFQESMI